MGATTRIVRSAAAAVALAALAALGVSPAGADSGPDRSATAGFHLRRVSTGGLHTCGVTKEGADYCWGYNTNGELGDGTTQVSLRPVPVAGLAEGVVSISAGFVHTCALLTSGAVKCWGSNDTGAVGDGTMEIARLVPTAVVGLSTGVAEVHAGGEHTCARLNSGAVKCWGGSGLGQVGDGTFENRLVPTPVMGLNSGVSAIAVGMNHSCAVLASGGARCWGLNSVGQLGDGTTRDRNRPVTVRGLGSVVSSIAGGYTHTCARTVSGAAKCWGENHFGQLGDGTTGNRLTPVPVRQLDSGVTSLTAGWEHTCARLSVGAVRCWGGNFEGQLGIGTPSPDQLIPRAVVGLDRATWSISAGTTTMCAVKAGIAMCWGNNHYGALGDGTRRDRYQPVNVRPPVR